MNAAEVIEDARAGLDDCLLSPWGERSIAALLALAKEQAATLARVREAVNRHPAPCTDTEWTCGWKNAVADIHFALDAREEGA